MTTVCIDGSRDSRDAKAILLAGELESRLSRDAIVRPNEMMAKRTTLRVGGPADVYVEPASEADLSMCLVFAQEHGLPRLLLGRGSNLLVRDGGVRGLVICLGHPSFSTVEVVGMSMLCGAGARLKVVAWEACRHGLAGLEFLEGIPGSVGGAIRMNAGAMGSSMFKVVEMVRFMDEAGQVRELPGAEFGAVYRECGFFKRHIALRALLNGKSSLEAEVKGRMEGYSQRRWQTQPPQPSAGCIFKNPQAIPAGRLVEELGLKGTRIGGATVSEMHGNFIVNTQHATATDVLALIELVRTRARSERGIELETEVEIVGELERGDS